MSSTIDIAYFPHVLDGVVDELYRVQDVETLKTLRGTSSAVRDTIDRKLRSHLVVNGKQHKVGVTTRVGALRLDPDAPASLPCAQGGRVVDVHHFEHHAVCTFDAASLSFAPCAAEAALAGCVRAARPAVVRLFDSRGFAADACGARTLVHFARAGHHFGAGVKVKLVPGVHNVVNVRCGRDAGKFEVLWGDGDACPECLPPRTPKTATALHAAPAAVDSKANQVVLLLTLQSGDTCVQDPPDSLDLKRGLANSLIVSAIAHLHRRPDAKLLLVGAEAWSPGWFQTWPIQRPPPDAGLSPAQQVRYLFDLVFLHYGRLGWTCAPHYAQKVRCTSLSDEQIVELRSRVEFVTEEEYRSRVGDETFKLYTVE